MWRLQLTDKQRQRQQNILQQRIQHAETLLVELQKTPPPILVCEDATGRADKPAQRTGAASAAQRRQRRVCDG